MATSESYIRVVYDDRERFPWVVMWGADNVWCKCRTRHNALYKVSKLRSLVDAFEDWKDE